MLLQQTTMKEIVRFEPSQMRIPGVTNFEVIDVTLLRSNRVAVVFRQTCNQVCFFDLSRISKDST